MSTHKIPSNDQQWREKLSPEQYDVLRQEGHRAPVHRRVRRREGRRHVPLRRLRRRAVQLGHEVRVGHRLAQLLPSPAVAENVELHARPSHGMVRTEVTCAHCGCAPRPRVRRRPGADGQRYCINSCALDLDRTDAQ